MRSSSRVRLDGRSPSPHVVGERRHRELLGDLRLADERAGAAPADDVPLAREVVERGAKREPGDAEIRAQRRSDGIAFTDFELLDEIEHEIAGLALLRHGQPIVVRIVSWSIP